MWKGKLFNVSAKSEDKTQIASIIAFDWNEFQISRRNPDKFAYFIWNSKRIPKIRNYDIQTTSTWNTAMHWIAIAISCRNYLFVLHIQWPTV